MKQILSVLILFCSQLVHSQTVPFRFRIVTWNVGNSVPDCGTFEHLAFASVSDGIKPDLIVFGFQEASKKLIGTNSFHKTLKHCLQNKNYIEILSDYVGSNIIKPIWLYVYGSNITIQSQRVNLLKYGKESTLKVYQDKIFENIIGYKGVIASRIRIDKLTNMIFVNMHLPAGEGKIQERCKLWSKFLHIYETDDIKDEYMFVFGDQNWRTRSTLTMDNILEAIKRKEYQTILNNDELTQMRQKSIQCLNSFSEAPITFAPTYKYILNSDEYQIQKNNEDRRPSYTDRILISKVSQNLEIIQYSAMNEIKLSDHRPVFADFRLYRQITNNKTSQKRDSNRSHLMETGSSQLSKKNPLILIVVVVTIAVICILSLLAIYHFIIQRQTPVVDIPQALSTDFAPTRSNPESTFTDH